MRNKFRFRFGRASIISTLIGSAGYFIINDLKKENSLIKNIFKKIALIKINTIKDSNDKQINSDYIKIIDDSDQGLNNSGN